MNKVMTVFPFITVIAKTYTLSLLAFLAYLHIVALDIIHTRYYCHNETCISHYLLILMQKGIMLHEIECLQHVVIPTKDLDTSGMVPIRSVVTNLLKQLTMYKALEEFGYFLGVTKLKTIDNGRKHDSTKYIDFLVAFNCHTLLPMKGEVRIGIVHTISRFGVFLKSGPMNVVYLSTRKMPNYYFVDEGKPLFMSNDLSRIEKGVLIRFVVFATRWSQRTRDISVLASIDGESLGPVATAGLDGFEL